ncbi:MAG TPA: adenylate kinase [Candidatus Binatia bacterium]|jgi:adenylate kinase
MRLVLVGPPGSGKGTQGDLLEEALSVPHISSGDLLRQSVSSGTNVGQKAKDFMDRGQLVPDELVLGLIRTRVCEADCRSGFVLDGFPRNPAQAEKLQEVLDKGGVDHVIALEVPVQTIVGRLSGRRTCRNCGRLYHVTLSPPKVEGACDACGGELFVRDDDRESTVRERLAVYHRQTEPLMGYYAGRGLLRRVDGAAGTEQVTSRILAAVRGCDD